MIIAVYSLLSAAARFGGSSAGSLHSNLLVL
jgi:hypothetical protein